MIDHPGGAELGSTPARVVDLSIPWVLGTRPPYPLEDTMATSAKSAKTTTTDAAAEQATTRAANADDAAASNVTANDPAKDPETGQATHGAGEDGVAEPVEQDSHEDIVRRVQRLERFLL